MDCRRCSKYGMTCCGNINYTACRNFINESYNRPITNRDKLETLSNEELTRFMLYDLPCIIRFCTNSERGLNDWLNSTYAWTDFRVSKHSEYSKYIEELSK